MDKPKYDNTNKGAIWKNTDKKKDTQPDFKGSIDVEGVEYFLNAWKRREGASEKSPALNFSVMKKESNNEIPFPKEEEKRDNITQDDIPF
tara:strand:+ start:456 stop:725 length:270 start_codon:yes stop_codon:yes gene_type:complete